MRTRVSFALRRVELKPCDYTDEKIQQEIGENVDRSAASSGDSRNICQPDDKDCQSQKNEQDD